MKFKGITMTMDIEKLISGKEYTLSDLFTGKNKIIIPDLQRDYCWGDKAWNKDKATYTELVSGFLDSLLSQFLEKKEEKENKDLTLGLIYAYENPKHHIQLCDGQQRLTTLYLILGMINRKTNYQFQEQLISKFELERDDKEPHLQYAIRESTLYFLSDLVCEFFLGDDFSLEDIRNKDWYFSEYDLDASIQSMLSALKTINNKFTELGFDFSFSDFGNFIINQLKVIYYDMGDRTRGEETFVVINTTGEPLTATENLKPKLIGNIELKEDRKKASDIWEKWEAYFWQNKKNDEHVADDGLNEFLKFYWQIKTKQVTYSLKDILQKIEPNEEIDSINEYFDQYKKLAEYFNDKNFKSVLNSINQDATTIRAFTEEQKQLIILPMLNFMKKFPDEKEQHRLFLRRLRKNYYDNQWQERKHNFIDWRHIIQIIEKSTSEQDVLTFDTSSEERKKEFKTISWYNEEEQYKTELRGNIENKIEEWEDHKDFMGDITPLMTVSEKSKAIDNLNSFYESYKNLCETHYFKSEVNLNNLYELFKYVNFGQCKNGTIAGLNYCMLVGYKDKLFLKNKFVELWKVFKKQENKALEEYLQQKLSEYLQNEIIPKDGINNFSEIKQDNVESCNKKVRLWAFLEYLYQKYGKKQQESIYFEDKKNISCFLGFPNLVVEPENSNTSIGNFLFGTSYSGKRVKFDYCYPLMKELDDKREKNIIDWEKNIIDAQTKKYLKWIEEFIKTQPLQP